MFVSVRIRITPSSGAILKTVFPKVICYGVSLLKSEFFYGLMAQPGFQILCYTGSKSCPHVCSEKGVATKRVATLHQIDKCEIIRAKN